jgi:hypothetical protein
MESKREPNPMQDPVPANETYVDYQTYIEPFVGWRAWNIHVENDEVSLRSITYQRTWHPGIPFTAECVENMWNRRHPRSPHKSPSKECGCGIHAVMNMEDAFKWHGFGTLDKMRCVGEADLWGVVYRYTRGYLAQYAYPKNLLVPHEVPKDFPIDARECVRELRKTYKGVKVNLL